MIALDLFAGHGWGVACQKLGIEEYGVEIMPEAIATRELNGMTTIYNDVWEGLEERPVEAVKKMGKGMVERHGERPGRKVTEPAFTIRASAGGMEPGGFVWKRSERLDYDLLIASPPCQTFSMAGGGVGRKALDDVLGLIDAKAYRSVAALRAFGESHDPRTALVLTPLAHVYRDLPRYVVFEQVPPVLPVWERCAEEMRAWGYSVWTGNLQAEMYGVPQTRKRAILIAKRDPELDGEAAPPTPTHSRYYSRDPKRLDEGVLPWVSMADALGWGRTARPFITAGNAVGRAEGAGGSGGKSAIEREKSRGAWVTGARAMRGAGQTERYGPRPDRPIDAPALTLRANGGGNATGGFVWTKRPATTVQGDPHIAAPGHHERQMNNAERVTVAEAAALQSYPPGFTFAGTKAKQFLQVGNAVPPLLAEAILRAVIS